jgi:hypothetical protein
MRRIEKSYTPRWVKNHLPTIVYIVCSGLFWSSYFGWNNRDEIIEKLFPYEPRKQNVSKGPFSDALSSNKLYSCVRENLIVACPTKKQYR